MGVPELVHFTQQHLSDAMQHSSSPCKHRLTAPQSQLPTSHSSKKLPSSNGCHWVETCSFPLPLLCSFQKTYHKLISSIKPVFYPKSMKADKQGFARIQDSRMFLASTGLFQCRVCVKQLDHCKSGVGQQKDKGSPTSRLLSRLNFLSWAELRDSCSLGSG